jgi:exopolysaccharide biosynthesis polyprenyl glycosylphosphotransferase
MSLFKKLILLAGDVAVLYAALAATIAVRYPGELFEESFATHLFPFSVIFILWIAMFYLTDLYRHRTLQGYYTLLRAILPAVILSAFISIAFFYLFEPFFRLTPKTNLIIFCGFFLLIGSAWRSLALKLLSLNHTRAAIVGTSPLIEETVEHLKKHPHLGYRIVRWFKEKETHDLANLSATVATLGIRLIVIHPHFTKNPEVLKFVYRTLPSETNSMNFSDFYEMIFEKIPLKELEEGWFLEHIAPHRPFYGVAKRTLDFALALFLMIVFLPVALAVAALIALTSKGSVIFRQERVGINGRGFTLYKFRSMYHNAGGPLWTEAHDRRVTPVGRVLRFTHLDEIPQLLNILKNDISFIGPRPERIELAREYGHLPYYELRHIVKPGVTGWAQINYRPSASVEEAYKKLQYDIFYVKNRSLLLDLLIALKTIRYLVTPHR